MVSTLSTLGYGPSVPAKMQAKDVSKKHCIHVMFIVYVCCSHIRSTNQSNGHRLTSGHCPPFILTQWQSGQLRLKGYRGRSVFL